MSENFFAPRKKSRSNKLIDLTKKTDDPSPGPPKKKKKHTVDTNNFTEENILNRLQALSRGVQFSWRSHQGEMVSIPYTIVTQKWTLDDKNHEISHFSPWGMHKSLEKKMAAVQVKSCFNTLPAIVKEKLGITVENFRRDDLQVTATNMGYHPAKPFHRLYCKECEKLYLPQLLNNEKYGKIKTLESLIEKWDDLNIPSILSDIVGCFLCTLDAEIHAGPNKKHFLKVPADHFKMYHPQVGVINSKQKLVQTEIQTLLAACSKRSSLPAPSLALDPPNPSFTSIVPKPSQTVLIGKYCQKKLYQAVTANLAKKISVAEDCRSPSDVVARGFCFSIVHTGVNKRISEATTIENYHVAYKGIVDHHHVQEEIIKEFHGIEDNETTIRKRSPVPRECSLDKNNIVKYERNILKVYQEDPDSIYTTIKERVRYWGIMHDGIQKYCQEYNGMFITALHLETFTLLLVPFRLMPMAGGVDAHDTVQSLFVACHELLKLKNSAFDSILKHDEFKNCTWSSIPYYFRLGVLKSVSETDIHIIMSDRLPVANTGDGVGVNVKAARVCSQLYGMVSPSYRCIGHSVDGCWKRIARSETKCVEQVKTLYNNLKSVVKHFKLSGKSKDLLDSSMKMLEMTKEIHLVTWCATRMSHFLVACVQFNYLLVPVYFAMFTEGIKPEERDKLFQVENVFALKVITDVHKFMHNKLMRPVDKSEALVSTSYNLADTAATNVINLSPPTAEKFLDSLSLDDVGNLMFEEILDGNSHTLRLTNPHHPKRGVTEEERLQKIKDSLKVIQSDILENIHDNLREQISEDTFFYPWSGLDLQDKSCNIEQRLEKLKPLVQLFTEERVHVVQKYRTKKEDGDTVPFKFAERVISLHYPKYISCSYQCLIGEINASWSTVSRLWLIFEPKDDQRKFWCSFLSRGDSGIMYPNFCHFINIMLVTPANTSPLERSYSGLEMICTPRRNHLGNNHLECLYLLSTLQLPVKPSSGYLKEGELLPTMK